MRKVVVLGVGMHPFGKFLDESLQDLGRTAIWNAIEDATSNAGPDESTS